MDQIGADGRVTTLVHLMHNISGEWRVACMPNMVEFHRTPYHPEVTRTDDRRAVTCPACKRSAIFKASAEVAGGGAKAGN